jgi:arginine exporter protein ArgO
VILLLGIFAGFVASTPLGPINLVVAESILSKRSVYAFLAGVVIIDALFATVAMSGFQLWMTSLSSSPVIILGGSVFFILVGIAGLVSTRARMPSLPMMGSFLKGILLCGLNPAFFLYWIFVSNLIASNYSISLLGIGFFGMGVLIGNIIWFYLFIRLLKFGEGRIGQKWIAIIRSSLSVLLIFLGVYVLSRYLLNI